MLLAAARSLLAAWPAWAAPKVLRYAFEVAESALDPAKVNDLYSRTLTGHIFEAPYHYDPLARPVKIVPLTAAGMPEISPDFRVWTIKLKPGIRFADDPAFEGRKRELVADDYVYTFQRIADPATRSPTWTTLEAAGILGLAEARQSALDRKQPFDYGRKIEGLQALDRYTLRITLAAPRPRLIELLATSDLFGAVAREVFAFYGEAASDHPVGTGPFKLAQWRKSSFIALERNPDYREVRYDAEPAADDAEGQAMLARFKGRRLPMIDRVEISIIEEDQPRWLAFLTGAADLAYGVGFSFVDEAMPNGRIAPNLARRGIRGYQVMLPASGLMLFNMDDPIVGGYGAEKVALRRAIGLGMDIPRLIAYAYHGQGTPAQTPLLPFTRAYDPTYRSEFGEYDPARAKGLLDLYGYKLGLDGWRSRPDGSPLVLAISTQSDQRSHKTAELMERNMRTLGIRVEQVVKQWPENLKAARAGHYMMWSLASLADAPDSIGALARYDSRQIGGQNMGRVAMTRFDSLYDQLQALPDGPARNALFRQAENLAVAFMPYKFTLIRYTTDLASPQLIGYRRPVFWVDWWQYVDIDDTLRAAP